MSRSAVYFILFLFAVYFSFVTGKIIADIDSSGDPASQFESEELSYSGGSNSGGSSVSQYFNPFAGVKWNSEPYSSPDANYSRRVSVADYSHSSSSGYSYNSFISSGSGSSGTSSRGGGGGGGSGTAYITSSGSGGSSGDEISFAPAGNPFGGLISQLDQISRSQSGLAAGGTNPTGSFGLKLGVADEFGVQNAGTPGGLEPVPLDDGVYLLLTACLILAGLFIHRPQKQVA